MSKTAYLYAVFHSNFAANFCADAISRVSFLDLFEPITGVTNSIMQSLLHMIGLRTKRNDKLHHCALKMIRFSLCYEMWNVLYNRTLETID